MTNQDKIFQLLCIVSTIDFTKEKKYNEEELKILLALYLKKELEEDESEMINYIYNLPGDKLVVDDEGEKKLIKKITIKFRHKLRKDGFSYFINAKNEKKAIKNNPSIQMDKPISDLDLPSPIKSKLLDSKIIYISDLTRLSAIELWTIFKGKRSSLRKIYQILSDSVIYGPYNIYKNIVLTNDNCVSIKNKYYNVHNDSYPIINFSAEKFINDCLNITNEKGVKYMVDAALNKYLQFYKNLKNFPNYMTENDHKILENKSRLQEFNGKIDDYDKFYSEQNNHSLTNYLIPEPFCGNVKESKIIFINYNPKLSGKEYKEQTSDAHYKEMLIDVLEQKTNSEYPFFALNPEYNNHAAYDWWKRLDQSDKNKSLIRNIVSKLKEVRIKDVSSDDIQQALKEFSKLFCNIELVPYHSKKFNPSSKWVSELDVTKETIEFIKSYLIPKANNGEILLLIRNGVADVYKNITGVSIKENDNIFIERLTESVSFGIGNSITKIGEHILNYVVNNKYINL